MIALPEVRAVIEAMGIRPLAGPHLHTVWSRDGRRSWQIVRVRCHVASRFALHVLRASPEQAERLNGGKPGEVSLRFLVEAGEGGVRLGWLRTTGRKRIGGAAHRGGKRKAKREAQGEAGSRADIPEGAGLEQAVSAERPEIRITLPPGHGWEEEDLAALLTRLVVLGDDDWFPTRDMNSTGTAWKWQLDRGNDTWMHPVFQAGALVAVRMTTRYPWEPLRPLAAYLQACCPDDRHGFKVEVVP